MTSMKSAITILVLFSQICVFGQSTFKKFKDTKTGAVTAYADGIKIEKF